MAAAKSILMTFLDSPRFKTLLEAVAAHEDLSLTSMQETPGYRYWDKFGRKEPVPSVGKPNWRRHA